MLFESIDFPWNGLALFELQFINTNIYNAFAQAKLLNAETFLVSGFGVHGKYTYI